MFEQGRFHPFPSERVPAEELPEQRGGEWRVSGYESCPVGPPSEEFPPLAGREAPPREGEKTPTEINKFDPHPEGILAVPCVGETMHLMLAKLANGALRCGTCGLPPYKLEHDTSSSKRRKGHEEEKAGKLKRVKLGGNHDMATVALSHEGAVLNLANGALLPGHASVPGARCPRTCLTCTDALLRFGTSKFSSVVVRREQVGVSETSRERRLRAARAATHQNWRPLLAEMRQELAAADEPGSEGHLAAF